MIDQIVQPIHEGETAIIIGNGKSLNNVPRDFLGRHQSFGVNHIYKLPFQPTYYICIDTTVLLEHADAIYSVASKARIAFISSYHLKDTDNFPYLKKLYELENVFLVGRDTSAFRDEEVMSGHTGAYVSLKKAYYLGFETVLLVGVDHDQEHKHFVDDYPPGTPTTLGKLQAQRRHFALANRIYQVSGRRIVNLSPPSLLDQIFERGIIEDWM